MTSNRKRSKREDFGVEFEAFNEFLGVFQVLGLYRLEPQAVACRAGAPKRVSRVVFDIAFCVAGKLKIAESA